MLDARRLVRYESQTVNSVTHSGKFEHLAYIDRGCHYIRRWLCIAQPTKRSWVLLGAPPLGLRGRHEPYMPSHRIQQDPKQAAALPVLLRHFRELVAYPGQRIDIVGRCLETGLERKSN